MYKKLLYFIVITFFSLIIFANTGPDEIVRKTAEDVSKIVPRDKDIQAGGRNKI